MSTLRGHSGIVESGILGFGIRDRAQGIQNPVNDTIRNPNSTDKESWIQYLKSGILGLESRIRDWLGPLTYVGPESRKFLVVDSGILDFGLGIRNSVQGIGNYVNDWNPESKCHWKPIRNPVPGILNPQRKIQNPGRSWITPGTGALRRWKSSTLH